MGKCAGTLLLGCMRWLENEGGLDGEEEAGGVEELEGEISDGMVGRVSTTYRMRGEEDELMGQDCSPDNGCELQEFSEVPLRIRSSRQNLRSICLPARQLLYL